MQPLREVTKTGMKLAIVAMACRVASAAKEILVAGVFGATIVTDVYWLAMLLPVVVMGTLGMAARTAYLAVVPNRGTTEVGQSSVSDVRFLASLLAVSIGIAVFAAILISVLGGLLFPVGSEMLRQLRGPVLMLACGLIVPMTLSAGLLAVLNARERFLRPQLTSLLPTLGVVAAVWSGEEAGSAAMLLAGLLGGAIVQVIVLAVLAFGEGMVAGPTFSEPGSTEAVQRIWRVALPLMMLGGLAQMNTYVDRTMAGALPVGSVAILSWSSLVRDFLSGTFIGSFLWVLLPQLAQHAGDSGRDELWRRTNQILEYGSLLLFPLTAAIVIVCPVVLPAITFGQFGPADATAITWCVVAYSFGAFADLAGATMFQTLLVVGRLRLLLWLAFLASFLPNLVFNLLLIGPWGEVGLAAATSIVAYLSLIVHYLALKRFLKSRNEQQTVRSVAIAFLAAIVMAGVGFAIVQWTNSQLPPTLAFRAAGAGFGCLVALAIYYALVSRLKGASALREMVRGKLRQMR